MEQKYRLFTPGPLCTTQRVKEAMLTDYGSRDPAFSKIVKQVRQRLVEVALADPSKFTTVISK
jgi:2-aminoethylphosphonate-pyruvate transaminase